MRRWHAALIALLAAATVAACGRHSPSPSAKAGGKPRLVVLIVIDQWPSWVFAQQKHVFTGGIGRMLREGAIVPAADIPHTQTFTAPGHATIATGTVPRVHGIVGNYWYRRDEGRDRPAEYDPVAIPFAVGERYGDAEITSDDGSSAKALRVEGIADALRKGTNGKGTSIAIALKSRSASLVAGKQPDLAVWYEPGAGGMTTSSAYAKGVPQWLVDHAAAHPVKRFFASSWAPGDPALLARTTKLPDDAPGEASNHGFDATMPHSLATMDKPWFALQETPFADEIVAETVQSAITALELGRDDVPDLLAISFGAHDYAGHGWGPDSWEVLDLTLRLDRLLGELFTTLDTRVGEQQWAAILTSDHGATPVPDRARASSARRVTYREIETAAEAAVEAQLGSKGPWVAKLTASNLYMTKQFVELPEATRGPALDAAANAIAAVPNIAMAGRTDRLSTDCKAERDMLLVACNARAVGASGELYVYAAAGSVIADAKFGTGHDAPFSDNREIPILVRAPGLRPQEGQGTQLQIAPTLAALLGVQPPEAATQPPLFGITRR